MGGGVSQVLAGSLDRLAEYLEKETGHQGKRSERKSTCVPHASLILLSWPSVRRPAEERRRSCLASFTGAANKQRQRTIKMKTEEVEKKKKQMKPPRIVSSKEWEAARQQLLAKEKEVTHARDALAAERRRMPWLAVEKNYEFEGPKGKASLLDLFDGRRQLIVYRAFFEPGVVGWPDHACVGCSMVADQVAHPLI